MAATDKYKKLATQLEQEIIAGVYYGGFPQASDLSKEKKVAINTVKAALGVLEGKGLIRKQGTRYFLTNKTVKMTAYVPPPHARFEQGWVHTLGPAMRGVLPKHIKEKFPDVRGESCVDRMLLSGETVEGKKRPMQITHRYHLLQLSDEVLDKMSNDAIYDPMYDGMLVPSELLRASDEIAAREATIEERKLLNLEQKHTSVLSVIEAIKEVDSGNILMIQEVILSPNTSLMFEYVFKNRPEEGK